VYAEEAHPVDPRPDAVAQRPSGNPAVMRSSPGSIRACRRAAETGPPLLRRTDCRWP
jgi:hypothetical protein